MTDPTDLRGTPGYESAMNSFSASSKSLQAFATEVQRMARESFENTSQSMEKLRSAKTLEEVMSIQSSFMQQSFAASTEYARRFSELMMALPMELARNSRDAFQQGTDAMTKAAEKTGEQMQKAGEQFQQHQG